jgi:hypothetical protein
MAQRSATLLVSNEADVQLAVSSIKSHQIQSNRRAATVYNVSERTIRRRRAGKLARRDCQPNSKKLTQLEEEVIVSHILDLDLRGFAPTYAAVRDMANKLLVRAVQARLGKSGQPTLLSVQIVLRRVLTERTTGRELCARIQS